MRRMMLGALTLGLLAAAGAGVAGAGDKAVTGAPKAPAVPDGIEELNRLTGLDPVQGELHVLLEQPEKAKALIQAALPLAGKEGALRYNAALVLALAAADQKDYKACDAFFHVCAAIAAKEQSTTRLAQSYLTLIELYYDAKQYGDCVRVCEEVVKLKTDDGKPRLVLRAFTDDHGETDFNEYTSFDSARPLRPVVQRYQVQALAKLGKYDEALRLAEKLVKNDTDWLGLRLKATVLREEGKNQEAANLYEDILGKVETDAELTPEKRGLIADQIRAEVCNVYVDLGKIDQAAEHYEALIKKHPDEPGFYNDLGYVLADHDMKLDEAEKLVRKALELDKVKRQKSPKYDPKTDHDNGAYLDSLGWVLYKKKELKEARKYLEMAVADKATRHIEIYDHLGDVCAQLGDRDAAINAWEQGLKYVTDTRRDRERRAVVEKKLERAKSKSAAK